METPPFVAYFRVSTDQQSQSGLGLEAQAKAVKDYVSGRGGIVLKSFTEVETGKGFQALKKRPQLAAALEACRKPKATLLIASLDRLARNVHFISGLMETRIPFVAVDMPNASPFEIHIRAAMAEEERRRISSRTKAALAAAKRRGVELGQNGKRLAQENRAAANVFAAKLKPVIQGLRSEGIGSVRAIAAALNSREISTARGGRWHIRTVQNLLNRI